MSESATDQWLLPILAMIRRLPGNFLGDERVDSLDTFMAGYEQGRMDAGATGMTEQDAALLDGFNVWLAKRANYDLSAGSMRWRLLIKKLDGSERNVHTFFRLFEEFLAGAGKSLDDPQPWVPSGW